MEDSCDLFKQIIIAYLEPQATSSASSDMKGQSLGNSGASSALI